MKDNNAQKISDLNGLGPKSQDMLERAGLMTVEQLKSMGSNAAFVKTRESNNNVSLNLLWALESALTGEKWHVIAKIIVPGYYWHLRNMKRHSTMVSK